MFTARRRAFESSFPACSLCWVASNANVIPVKKKLVFPLCSSTHPFFCHCVETVWVKMRSVSFSLKEKLIYWILIGNKRLYFEKNPDVSWWFFSRILAHRKSDSPKIEIRWIRLKTLRTFGSGSVDRVVASDPRDPQVRIPTSAKFYLSVVLKF